MPTIGIVSEYNPFHSGHRHHLETLRQQFGADTPIVCVMSGSWVQRGDAAIADKWARASLALQGGVDLVLELPTLWAVSSAETFARGGVSLLAAAGVVDTLSFGSESGDLADLQAAALCLDSGPWREELRKALDEGLPFPVARQRAAERLLGEAAACLGRPNDNLGVEYLRAIAALDAPLIPHTLLRVGAGHDEDGGEDISHASASYLRKKIIEGDPGTLGPYLSAETEVLLRRDPAALSFNTRGVLTRLRMLTAEDFARLPDCGEGLEGRLLSAVQEGTTLEEVYALAKSKRYTHARIRRLILWAYLGLTEADRPETPPYLRVLGFSSRGQKLLRNMKTSAALPVIVKPAHAARLEEQARRLFRLEARCTALYDLCRKEFGVLPGKNEFTQDPVRI